MKTYFLWLLLVLSYVGSAQTVTIRDSETDQPLSLVTLTSQSASAITDARGQVDISNFKGDTLIEVRSLGYSPLRLAYDEIEARGFKLQLEPGNITMDQFVVVASRWNQTQKDVPAKIATITAKDIALQNPQTAADLLGASGEVYIQKSQQGGGSPMIRGFATNRLLITVDGIRMNTAIFRSGNVQNVINLDPFATESAEVMFGPGSIMYGSDAIGGVMSFNTLTPILSSTDKPIVSGKAVGRYASANNEQTAHLDVNVGWRKWAMVTSFTNNDYDDLRMGSYGPTDYLKPYYVQRIDSVDRVFQNDDSRVQRPSAYGQINLMQKVRFKPNERWDFTYAFHYSETSEYGRYDRHNRTRNGLPRYAEWKYGPQTWMMNNLSVNHFSEGGIYDELNVRLAQQHFEESRIDRSFNGTTRSIRVERVEAYSANLDLMKAIATRHKLYYGVEGVFNDVHSIGRDQNILTAIQSPGPSRYPESTWSSYAAYANYQFQFSQDVTIQTGLRYNQFMLNANFDTTFYPFPFEKATIDDGKLTGSFGVVYNPGETWSMSLNAATGFRAPNVDDVGKVFDSEPGAVTVPNPGLSAEYAYNLEAGITKIIGGVLKVDATGFYTLLEHAMVRRNFQLNGMDSIVYDGTLSQVQAIQNAAMTEVYGVQAGFEAKLPKRFGVSGRFNYQLGKEELDNGVVSPSRHAAPWFSIAHLTYTANHLKFDFYGIYNDEVRFSEMPFEEQGKTEIYAADQNGNPYTPAWYTINFKMQYQVNDYLALNGGVENITDQRYRPYSSGLSGAGRNFLISARVMF